MNDTIRLDSIDAALDALRRGGTLIVVDDEDAGERGRFRARGGEGDARGGELPEPSTAAGLICLAATRERMRALDLRADGGRQPGGAGHGVHRVGGRGPRHHDGHLRPRPRAHGRGLRRSRRAPVRSRAPGPPVPPRGAAGRRPAARGAHRGRGRSRAAWPGCSRPGSSAKSSTRTVHGAAPRLRAVADSSAFARSRSPT